MRSACLLLMTILSLQLFLGCSTPTGPKVSQNAKSSPSEVDESPCRGVDRNISEERKSVLARAIAKQVNSSKIEVLRSFKSGSWTIVDVNPLESDEAFLFYADEPATSRYLTLWSGAAKSNENETVRDWTRQNAPNIPVNLANCFAWYVTNDRR